MSKIAIVLLIAALAVVNAEPLLRRASSRLTAPSSRRVLARQEAADEAAITPYPSADELKPDVPFDEAAELPAVADEEAPEVTLYNIPDEVYGPPEGEITTVEPAAEQFPGPLDAEEAQVLAEYRSAKLRQRQAAYRKAANAKKRSAKLRAANKAGRNAFT